MQELIDFLEPELKMQDFLQLPAYEKVKSLLQKEKQQIIDARIDGVAKSLSIKNEIVYRNGSALYYNETFN